MNERPEPTTGPHCPIDLMARDRRDPYEFTIETYFDDDGFEQGEKIIGYDCCPKCGLWYPCVAQPDSWELHGLDKTGKERWFATGWWGGTVCNECELLMIEQPDGAGECYQL